MVEQLTAWELTGLIETATLSTSELVTNAVVHAHSNPWVTMAVSEGALEVSVADQDPRLPVLVEHRPATVPDLDLPTGGRGLLIVAALANDWGALRVGHGKQVWFRQLVPADWPHHSSCECHHHHSQNCSNLMCHKLADSECLDCGSGYSYCENHALHPAHGIFKAE